MDQGLGFGWFAIGGFEGQLEAGGGFAIEPFTQLYGAKLVEVGAGAVAGFGNPLEPAQGGFIAAHTKNLPGNHHGGATKQNDQTDEISLGKQMIHGPTRRIQLLAAPTTAVKLVGSTTASWASILRLICTSAFLRPPISRL